MFSQMNRTLCLANCADPDQTANHAPSNLDQHCLSISQNKGWLTRSIQGQVNFVFFPWSRYKKHLNTFLPDSRFLNYRDHLLIPQYKLGVQKHARIQRGTGDPDPPPPPLKNHKNIGFLSSTGPDLLKFSKCSKLSSY